MLLVSDAIKSLEDEFPDLFIRIHRNDLAAHHGLAGL
jgi:hypothetical protein